MITPGLLVFSALVLSLAPRMVDAAWTSREPRLALWVWQAAAVGVLTATVLAGLTLLVPVTTLGGSLADIFDACALTVASVYDSPGRWPGVLLGSLLAGVLPLWLLAVAVHTAVRERAARRHLHSAISLSARNEPSLGVLVLDSPRAAAFCIPGPGKRIVVTSGALSALSDEELAGVLAHERAHLRARHQLAVAGARVLRRAFPGVTLFACLKSETERLVELLADDAAARRTDRISLASALVTLAGMRSPTAALPAADGLTAARVGRLLSSTPPVRRMHQVLAGAAAMTVVAAPVALAIWPLWSAIASGLCTVPSDMGWA